jgi:ribose 5-phosphate isomerase B
MKIAIGSDHAGFELRHKLVSWLGSSKGGEHQVVDLGCPDAQSCDYPDYAAAVGRAVSSNRVDRGILICGTGIGMGIAANKVSGVRAAVAWNPETAALAAEHNKANVLCIPARFAGPKKAEQMIAAFLKTPFGGARHARRVEKIEQLEESNTDHAKHKSA